MADDRDAEILQIFDRQARQEVGVDRVVAERRFVLPETEVVEPGRDVHGRLHSADWEYRLYAVVCKASTTSARGRAAGPFPLMWRNPLLPSKSASSPFSPIHRADHEGLLRVDSGLRGQNKATFTELLQSQSHKSAHFRPVGRAKIPTVQDETGHPPTNRSSLEAWPAWSQIGGKVRRQRIVLKNSDFRFGHNHRAHREALKNLGVGLQDRPRAGSFVDSPSTRST